MSGNNNNQQQQQSPGGQFRTPAGILTGRRISDQFTPGSGFRGPSLYQQRGGQSTPGTSPSVHFAPNVTGGAGGGGGGGQQGTNQTAAGGRQGSKFVRTADVPDADMLDVDVALRKEDYGVPGSSDYRKNMASATEGLRDKFGVPKHKVTTAGEEGDQTKHQYVQQSIVSTLHRVKEGHERSKKTDWMDICLVADYSGDIENADCTQWWGESEINIWTDWEKISEQQARAWQYSVNKRFSDGDRIASTWLREFVYNSSTDSLRSVVAKKYDKLPSNQRGGVMYLYYTLCEMFQMSREVKDAMLAFLGIFKRKGVARYTGENIIVVEEEVIGICKRLASVGALLEEHVIDILQGMTICGNARFKDTFKHLKQSADLGHLTILEGVTADSTPLEKIEAVMAKGIDMYDMLCLAGVWLPNSDKGGTGGRMNTIVGMVNACWNCGETGHGVARCPKPKDQARIAKNKKAHEESKNSDGGAPPGGSGGGRNSRNRRGKNKDVDKGSTEYKRKLWEANSMKMVNGVLYVNCSKCGGLNTTHTTRTHEQWARNPNTFRLPASHLYVRECAELRASSAAPPPFSTNPPPPGSTDGSGSSSGSSGTITMDRASLESKLAAFERTSTDPNPNPNFLCWSW